MSWNEEQHPRDNEGKFTFKNGGKNSAAESLYGKRAKMEKEKAAIKEQLLNVLGKHATTGDILCGTEKSLKKKIEELGLNQCSTKLSSASNSNYSTPKNYNTTAFQKDTSKHEILRQLSVYSYDNGHQQLPKGYKRVGHFTNRHNGFDAVVTKNDKTKEIVIAYRGMELGTKDVDEVRKIRTINYTYQQNDAQAVYNKIKNNPEFKGYEIYTTGTSLGGYLAQYIAGKNNLKSATFNAYHGAKNALLKESKKNMQSINVYPDNIVNYRNKKDFLTKSSTKNNLGVSLDTEASIKRHQYPVYHFAENMGDLNKAEVTNKDFSKHITN